MIKLHCFLIAEYAAASSDGKLTIAGTFDSIDANLAPGAPPTLVNRIPLPRAYLAVVSEASIADGLTHQFRLRVLDGNGQPIAQDSLLPVAYSLNAFGRPMRHNLVVSLNGFVMPGADDYVFELSVVGKPGVLGELQFYVNVH